MATTFHSVTFVGAGRHHRAGRLHLPAGHPRAFALFAHAGAVANAPSALERIAEALAAAGVAVMRLGVPPPGRDEDAAADHADDEPSGAADIVAAAAFLRAEHRAPRLLIGHDFGGTAALLAAADIPEVVAVATVGARSRLGQAAAAAQARPAGVGPFSGLPVPVEAAARLGRALLVCHAPEDEVVSAGEARALFDAARAPKSFLALDGADHFISDPDDAAWAAGMIAAWCCRYADGVAAPSERPEAERGSVEVRGGDGLAQDVIAGGHRLRADEPRDLGGTDTGPNPYDFLLTALGSCISMTLRLYARRKQFPLEDVEIALRHEKIHAADCADCETRAGRIDAIEAVIVLRGPLTDAQRARLLEIAGKCPIHRTLKSEIAIRTRLAE